MSTYRSPLRGSAAAWAAMLLLSALRPAAGADGGREELARRMRSASRLAKESSDLIQGRQYKEALAKLVEADALLPGSPLIQYNMACALAMTGSPDAAVATLERAIASGFTDHEHMREDADLATLRERADFRKLVQAAIEQSKPQPPLVVLPANYEPQGARVYPLVVALHGAGANAGQMARTIEAALPRADYFVLAPYGSTRAGPGYTWNSGDLDTIAAKIAALRKEYRIGRVYLLGFSAGAHLGYIFSVKQRASIDGFIPMAGALRLQAIAGNELDRVKGLPVFAIQGANDQVVSPAAAKRSVAIFRDHGAVTTLHEHAGGHVAPPDCAKVLRQAIAWIEANLETAAVVR